jgi:hypothetical protein
MQPSIPHVGDRPSATIDECDAAMQVSSLVSQAHSSYVGFFLALAPSVLLDLLAVLRTLQDHTWLGKVPGYFANVPPLKKNSIGPRLIV